MRILPPRMGRYRKVTPISARRGVPSVTPSSDGRLPLGADPLDDQQVRLDQRGSVQMEAECRATPKAVYPSGSLLVPAKSFADISACRMVAGAEWLRQSCRPNLTPV